MREYILEIARDLCRDRTGVDFDEIAATAGVDLCDVHDHFRNLDDVHEALAGELIGAARV